MLALSRVAIAMVLATALMNPSLAAAQTLTPTAARYSPGPPPDTTPRPSVAHTDESRLDPAFRIVAGLVGGVVGSLGGAQIGASTARGCHGEWCGVGNVITGAAIGSVAGSALLSSLPGFGSKCGLGERFATGTAGALLGALTGGVAGLTMGAGGVVIGVLAGSGIGGGLGASTCP
jgi:hypothetical protein